MKCGLETGAVVVRVRPCLPVLGVSLILDNDLAGGQVACISNVPQDSVSPTDAAEQAPTKVYRISNSNSQQDLSREYSEPVLVGFRNKLIGLENINRAVHCVIVRILFY